ncbi:MAG: hypothetical protein KME54_26550 [Tolypothrix brevis GSE-NOS-MK-07-07A]|jgi:hypothetical protein|nr:hypothetical protein [Tolypothrix brevis GSE-NOS-MK-07-07A]
MLVILDAVNCTEEISYVLLTLQEWIGYGQQFASCTELDKINERKNVDSQLRLDFGFKMQ